ncbi:MAG: tRNA (guanosine(37)-N1)-methyltransferase TrmD [Clostridia bacterium]|nr:tRNA (guanosine(37)-N1)-methyltransferase TrmD [Clostridia bacterium]
MRFDVLTLFPEMFDAVKTSIVGRAMNNNLIDLNLINFREFSTDKQKHVDDCPYGGGAGMVIKPEPVYDAYKSIVNDLDYKPKVIYMSPQGKVLTQQIARELSKENHLILLCGHYEGIDQRVLDEIVDEEISIGDYVLTGGELPAMVLIDAVSRNVKGVIKDESVEDESFSDGYLEYPHYTRPEVFMGKRVPDILLSGHHANIEKWRREQSIEITKRKRPDLIKEERSQTNG